jgi:hypothetical protein
VRQPEIDRSRSTTRRFSSSVVGRADTASRSRSLSGRRPPEDGGAEQVDTENVWPEHLAHELDDALELTRVLPAEHASVSRR